MRQSVFVIILSALSIVACNDNKSAAPADIQKQDTTAIAKPPTMDTANFTTLRWVDSMFQDIGTLKRGDSTTVVFRFENTGHKPLVIDGVQASCGCTVPEPPKEPVLPGKTAAIKAKFYTQNQAAATHLKHIYVRANTHPHTGYELVFKAEIKE